MKTNNQFESYKYTINNTDGFGLTEALRLWRTKYKDIQDFDKEVITHEGMHAFRDFVHEMWDDIIPVTVQDALSNPNAETRRTYFDCIGVQTLFQELKPTLRDKQVIKKKRMRWDDNNDSYEYEFEDVYELYEIDGKKLFKTDQWNREPTPVFAVRCWCTTTNREYWIYVNEEAATGDRNFTWRMRKDEDAINYDAIRAIAWTIRLDVKNPERIYRQGDIIVAKLSRENDNITPYHLSKEQYLQLMYSET